VSDPCFCSRQHFDESLDYVYLYSQFSASDLRHGKSIERSANWNKRPRPQRGRHSRFQRYRLGQSDEFEEWAILRRTGDKVGDKFLDLNADGTRDEDGLDNIAGNADDDRPFGLDDLRLCRQ
jgi:hypothetical protein